MKWNPDILDKYIAPQISVFTQAEIPDLSDRFPEAPFWLGNHLLNSILRAPYKGSFRQLAMGFLFRAAFAFRAYHEARSLTGGRIPEKWQRGGREDVV